jgi:hypothetical protein
VKVTIQLVSLILAVKHNLCYWRSKNLVKHPIFPNYDRLLNLPIIKESQVQLYVYCMHIFSYMWSFLPQVLYTVWCLSKLYVHKSICKKKTCEKKARAQIGTNVRTRVFNAGLLARNHFASRRSYDHSTRSRFSVVFLGPRANAGLVPKFQIALHASHAADPMATLKISPYCNVTLTFDIGFGLDHPVLGGCGWVDLAL